jgi:hypothetical protein
MGSPARIASKTHNSYYPIHPLYLRRISPLPLNSVSGRSTCESRAKALLVAGAKCPRRNDFGPNRCRRFIPGSIVPNTARRPASEFFAERAPKRRRFRIDRTGGLPWRRRHGAVLAGRAGASPPGKSRGRHDVGRPSKAVIAISSDRRAGTPVPRENRPRPPLQYSTWENPHERP